MALRLGLVGHPVGHSLSPVLHRAAARAVAHPDADAPDLYRLFDVAPEALGAFVRGAALDLTGFNITVPHKVAALVHVDALEDGARVVGAVNTLWRTQGQWRGANTDVEGFASEVADLMPAKAVIFGAGGGARAAVYALLRAGWSDVRVVARRLDSAAALCEALDPGPSGRARPISWDGGDAALRGAALVVQATSAALSAPDAFGDLDLSACAHRAVALDMVYRPTDTAFLRAARGHGLETRDGLGMLVGQGLAAFERFTGLSAPRGPVEAAVRAAASLDTPGVAS